jgi:hypothetical protein
MQKPIHTGDLLTRGAGPDAARREQLQALSRRNSALGQDAMTAALQVIDDDVWRFVAWYRTVEARCHADQADAGLHCTGNGSGDGIPLSACQRLEHEIPLLLAQIMEHPEEMLERLDKQRGLC